MSRWRMGIGVQGAALVAIVVVAALLRLWQIDQIPPGFHFDESFEGLEAWRIYTDPTYRPIFLTGNFGVAPINAYANALTFAAAEAMGGEAGPTAMRVTAAIFGVLGVLAVFVLAREMHLHAPMYISPLLPWLAAATLATMRWHLHFSRMGIEPILVPLVWALAGWLLLRAWRTGAWWTYILLGITLAASMYTYQGGWFVPPLIALSALHLLWAGWREHEARTHRWSGLTVAAVVSIVGLLPFVFFFVEHSDLLILRPAQLAIIGETASPADSSFGDALWATAKMFGPFGAPGDLDPRRNLPGAPALNLWQAIPFYLGLLLALWHSRRLWRGESVATALPIIGLVGLLLPGALSEYAPHFHRILGGTAPVALLCGMGLDAVWRGAAKLRKPALRAVGPGLVMLLLLLGMITAAQNYFVRWANLPDLFYAFDEGLWQVGQWVAAQPSDQTIYISPQSENHATLAFAWRNQPTEPVAYDGRYILPLVEGTNPSPEHYVVIEHEDFRSGLLLPGVFPTLETAHVIRDAAGAVYARVYTRPANTPPQREPALPLDIAVGDGITLLGYDILPEAMRAGSSLYVQYHWQVSAPPATNWTVYNHLVDADGAVVAGFDSPPGRGSLVTTRWQTGWRVLDEYEIMLPADLPPGDYTLRMGLYDAAGNRLPADGTGFDVGTVIVVEQTE